MGAWFESGCVSGLVNGLVGGCLLSPALPAPLWNSLTYVNYTEYCRGKKNISDWVILNRSYGT